jgi:hypothetical protein
MFPIRTGPPESVYPHHQALHRPRPGVLASHCRRGQDALYPSTFAQFSLLQVCDTSSGRYGAQRSVLELLQPQ